MIKRLLVTMLMLLTIGVSALAEQSKEILLATTTSVRDSGLMDYLLPRFERESGYKVNLIAVGGARKGKKRTGSQLLCTGWSRE